MPKKLGFATPEHKKSGDTIELTVFDREGIKKITGSLLEMMAYKNNSVTKVDNLKLSYGDILALGGDYYATVQSIGSTSNKDEAKKLFITSFNSLSNKKQEKIVNKIFEINSKKYVKNETLNGYIQQIMLVATLGKKYFDITNYNLDHFLPWSIKAYETGHQVAMEMARKGYELRESGNYEKSYHYLLLAYQMNAFACHYLSDSFAAGHLRELDLREKLSREFGILGGILVNNMHNEDGEKGVNVKNENGNQWTAYGDDNYSKPQDETNRELQKLALQESADEVFKVFEKGHLKKATNVMKYLPHVDDILNKNYQHPQYAALFVSRNNKIYYRDPLSELNSDKVNYKELTFFRALVLVIKLRLFPKKYNPQYDLETRVSIKPTNTGDLMEFVNAQPGTFISVSQNNSTSESTPEKVEEKRENNFLDSASLHQGYTFRSLDVTK